MRNVDNKILNNNIRFSKTLKEIDTRLKFINNTQKHNIELKKLILDKKRKKENLSAKNKIHENIVSDLKKAEEENIKAYKIYSRNFKNNLQYSNSASNINISSTFNNYLALPKLTQLKKEFQDNEKNEGYKIIGFENVWKEQQLNELKYNRDKKIKNKTMYHEDFIDIFDKNYDKYRKKCEEYKEKNIILERIKLNNLKVNKKLKIFRHIMLKFQDIREYNPNYSILEKHQPEIKLNTKSKRIFPAKFIKGSDYNKFEINDNRNDEIKINKKIRKNNSDLLNYTKSAISRYPDKKSKFFLSSVDIRENRTNSVYICKNNKRIIIQNLNGSRFGLEKNNSKLSVINSYIKK